MKYRDREGRDVGVETGQDQFLKHLYGNAFGRAIIRIMIRPWVSRLGGYVLDSFILYNLITSEIWQTGKAV